MSSQNKNRSFTLIELLVVIAIIGLLAAVAVASLNNAMVRARDAKRIGDISQITKAIELSFAFNNAYPNSGGPVNLSVVCMAGSPPAWCAPLLVQMSNIPDDPLSSQHYIYNSDGSNFRIAAQLESSANATIAQNDGGFYAQYYEGYSATSQISLFTTIKYASATGGNWSSDAGTWVTTPGGSEVAPHPVQGDTVYLNSQSGNITVDTNSAVDDIDATGYTGTLTLNAGLTIYGNLKFVSGMTFTPISQTVTFAATTIGRTVTSGGKTFYNVTWNGSGGEWTLQDNFTQNVNGTINLTLGTLNLNGKSYYMPYQTITPGNGFVLNVGTGYFSGAGAWPPLVVSTGATVTVSTGELNTRTFTVSGTGTFIATGAATIKYIFSATISSSNWDPGQSMLRDYGGGASATLSSTQPLYNYGVYNGTQSLESNLTVQNNLSISSGVLSAGSYTINLGGNWASSGGTFTPGTSTVNFNDATKVSTISGSTTFNNLTSSTSDKTIKFTAGTTQTVSSLSLTGTSGHLITIDTDTGAGTFNLSDTTGTNTLYYTSVTRSAAAGGATWNALISDGNSNGGSNSGWNF